MLKKEFFSFVKTLAIALFFAGIIRSFIFEPFHIPSGSMKPNLLVGDYIIVTKYSYGYSRYSFPFGIDFFSGRKFFNKENQLQRGDIAVFRLPRDPEINYIKRIIGLPGDSIQMRHGVLYVNDYEVKKDFDGEFFDEQEGLLPQSVRQFVETLPNDKKIVTIDLYEEAPQDNTPIYKVPDGHYFMMGDNRDNSQDSRFTKELGFVPEENLVGKARFIFFSISQPVWQFWNWTNSMRLGRIFQKIE